MEAGRIVEISGDIRNLIKKWLSLGTNQAANTNELNTIYNTCNLILADKTRLYPLHGKEDIDLFIKLLSDYSDDEWVIKFAIRVLEDTALKAVESIKNTEKESREISFLTVFAKIEGTEEIDNFKLKLVRYNIFFSEIFNKLALIDKYKDKLVVIAISVSESQCIELIEPGLRYILKNDLVSSINRWNDLIQNSVSTFSGRYFTDRFGVLALKSSNFIRKIIVKELNLVFGTLAPTVEMLKGQSESITNLGSEQDYSIRKEFQWHLFSQFDLRKYGDATHHELFNKFGITQFGRYPSDVLRHIAENMDTTNKPNIIACFARLDYHGEFLKQPYTYLTGLVNEAETLGATVRVIEFSSQQELWDKIKSISYNYGKPIGIFLEGHGPNQLQYSFEDNGISTQSIISNVDEWLELEEYLHLDARIIVNCCSSGTVSGFAEQLSLTLSRPVSAQNATIGLDAISLVRDNKFIFEPIYSHNYKTVLYDNNQRKLQTWNNISLQLLETLTYEELSYEF
jgi:hypothetical protein